MTNLLNLPYEIVIEINRYLSNNDRFECSLVCQQLCTYFNQFVYNNLTFNNRNEFISRISEIWEKDVGFCVVRQMTLNDVSLQNYYFDYFLHKCHNLRELTIGRYYWSNVLTQGFDAEIIFAGFPFLPSLTTLDIDCDEKVSVEDLFGLLALCPNLKKLMFKHLLKVTLTKELEIVHNDLCTKLEELYLDHQNAEDDMLNLAFNNDDDDAEVAPVLNQVTTFKKMGIYHCGLWDDFKDTLDYMGKKYPNLEELEIEFHPSWNEDGEYNDLVDIDSFREAVDIFVRASKHLKNLKFKDVCWADMVFRQLFRTRSSLENIYLRNILGVSGPTFGVLVLSSFTYLKSLDLAIDSALFITRNYRELRGCHKLTKLRLTFKDSTLLNIPILIDACPPLEVLELDRAVIDCIPSERGYHPKIVPRHTNLAKLVLTGCNFNNRLWLYMEKKCPNLRSLELCFCTLSQGKSIILHFPQHCFRSIIIHHLRITFPSVHNMNEITTIASSEITPHEKKYVDFITIRRHHSDHPNPIVARGPVPYVKSNMCQTRAMTKTLIDNGGPFKQKIQTIKIDNYNYSLNQHGYFQLRHRPPENHHQYIFWYDTSYFPLEILDTYHFLTEREIDYYRNRDVDIPKEADLILLDGELEHNYKNIYFKEPQVKLAIRRSSTSELPVTSIMQYNSKAHLLIDVYRIAEFKFNGKWIIC